MASNSRKIAEMIRIVSVNLALTVRVNANNTVVISITKHSDGCVISTFDTSHAFQRFVNDVCCVDHEISAGCLEMVPTETRIFINDNCHVHAQNGRVWLDLSDGNGATDAGCWRCFCTAVYETERYLELCVRDELDSPSSDVSRK